MKKQDLEQIRLIVREEVRVEVQPVRDIAMSNNQTLHGVKGEGGLVNEVDGIRKKVLFITTGISTVLTTAFNVAAHLILKGKT